MQSDEGLEWHLNHIRHRDHKKPAVVYNDGIHEWWVHGQFIRCECATDFDDRSNRFRFVEFCVACSAAAAMRQYVPMRFWFIPLSA